MHETMNIKVSCLLFYLTLQRKYLLIFDMFADGCVAFIPKRA